ncbi:MAG: acyltransferase family protein [Ignavibacteriales bacterium]
MPRFTVLDSWRGVCALWVVLYHFRTMGHYTPVSQYGFLGVEFFFVLSGFVISHAYGERLGDTLARVQFTIRRFGRLYPLHLAMFAATLAMEIARWALVWKLGRPLGPPPFTGDTDPRAILANLTLTQGLGTFQHYTWNVPSWSISVELFLYATFALISLTGRSVAISVVLLIAGFFVRLWMGWLPEHLPEGYEGVPVGIYGFYAGAVLYRIYRLMLAKGWRTPGWAEWVTPFCFVGATVSVANNFWPGPVLFFAPLILIFAFEGGPLSKLMATRPLARVGEVSYSIYLLHYVLVLAIFGAATAAGAVLGRHFFAPTERPVLDFGSPWLNDGAAVAMVLLTILLANITYEWIERPGRDYFNRLAKHPAVARRFASRREGGVEPDPVSPGGA